MNYYRIVIVCPITGRPLAGQSVKELIPIFSYGNVVRYYIIPDEKQMNDDRQLNFLFHNTESKKDAINQFEAKMFELKRQSRTWFDKRTKAYKAAFTTANGFTLPLIFEEIFTSALDNTVKSHYEIYRF